MTGDFRTGAVLDAGLASRILSEGGAHDVVCVLPGAPVWQDIAVPGYSLLHIPDGDLWGEVFPCDGLTVSRDGDSDLFTYTVGRFLVRFSVDPSEGLCPFSIGSCPSGPAMGIEDARSVIGALSPDWIESPEGFEAVAEDIGSAIRLSYHRRELVPGLRICTDGSESWIESERSDFGVTDFRLDVSADGAHGVLWIYTDRCSFGFPAGGDVQ